jgi:hypothetical protein
MVIRQILDRFRSPAKAEHIMEDGFFGNLTWSEKYGGWRGMMTLANGKTVTFTIDGVETEQSITKAARNTFTFLIENEPLIRDKIAVSMSELYSGTWGGVDTITPDELAQRITLTDVAFYEEGGGELYYEADDDLFTDHTICASIESNGEIGEPELAG